MEKNETTGNGPGTARKRIDYKWIVLSITTIEMFMVSVNGSITLISLPAIFNGINIDPLTSFQYLIWVLMGYSLVTATLLLSCGRLSDMYGRVKFYNIGFAIFTLGSILLFLTPDKGDAGALEIIAFRIVQAVGASFTFSNSAAILTDAFPADERGKALGLNTMAFLSGQFVGLILGGILAFYNWRYVFLVSVPVGILGTVWAYLKLKETPLPKRARKIDVWGNITFVGGLTIFLIGITYALLPYGKDPMGWGSPLVLASLVIGAILLVAFPVIESRVEDPMFRLGLFKIRVFSLANTAGFLSALARGGMMFLLIMLLQGIWLPLHGYSYESTPFWAGVFMLPLTAGFVIMGPLSGWLSDKYGSRWFATSGLLLIAVSFLMLASLPYNFDYPVFAIALLIMGLGNGMFGTPNIAAIMNSVPPEDRGVASGMRSMLQNSGMVISMALFFTIVIVSLTHLFPPELATSLTGAGAPDLIAPMSAIPPTGALFAAFLGYNPVHAILVTLPQSVVAAISPAAMTTLTGTSWFPTTLAHAFMPSLRISFYIGALLSLIAAVLSSLTGSRFVHDIHGKQGEKPGEVPVPIDDPGWDIIE
ncbi:MFS transporter [Methanoregula sp.]|jgi:MFS family permease|uniref:MFS transporter n=1 Tax=Methanoregula sp. TaxID=2052170 RepID=UPI003C14EB38